MTFAVREQDDKIKVVYGSQRDQLVISSTIVRRIKEVKATLNTFADDYKDVLIERLKRSIEDDSTLKVAQRARQLLELAVYGRAVEKMHPSSLTHITLGFEPDVRKIFYSISCEVGREKQKLEGVR